MESAKVVSDAHRYRIGEVEANAMISQSSLSRSHACWVALDHVVVSHKCALSSWTTQPEASSATSRDQSRRTTFFAYWNRNARREDCDRWREMVEDRWAHA
ncbi:hypothetical protein MRB53_041742 [Persea americana]|nr:hypothetical protein MRB53_041742 [Persea americana]